MAYVIPLVILAVFVCAAVKKVKIYDEFSAGVKEAVDFILSLIPCLAAIFMMCGVFEASGLSTALSNFLAPAFEILGIPKEIVKLVLIKPFSGSGSIAYLTEIINEYGADSYISRCACVTFGSSETTFYLSAVYFAKVKSKKITLSIVIVLISSLLTTIFACFLCRVM